MVKNYKYIWKGFEGKWYYAAVSHILWWFLLVLNLTLKIKQFIVKIYRPILYSYLISCCLISDLVGKGEPILGSAWQAADQTNVLLILPRMLILLIIRHNDFKSSEPVHLVQSRKSSFNSHNFVWPSIGTWFESRFQFRCHIYMYFFALKCLRNEIFYFFLWKSTKNLDDCCLPFLSILVLELKSFEDAKVEAKSMDTKDVILVMSHTLNKYSVDFKTTI